MLRNVFLKTVRDYRISILVWGGGIGVLMLYYAYAFVEFFKGPDQAKLMEDYAKAVNSFSFFTGKATDVNTYGGFLTTEFMLYLPVLLGLFAMLTGSKLIRGEEEKGSLDLLLSFPLSRTKVLLEKWAGLVTMLAAITLLSWLGLWVGVALTNTALDMGASIVAVLNAALLGLLFGSLALMLGQLTSRKAAAGWTGGLMAATFLMNSLAGTVSALEWMRYLSPFYYYTLSKPMARSVGTDWVGITVLLAVTVPLVLAALLMYLRRDQGDFFQLSRQSKPIILNHYGKVKEPQTPWLANDFLFALRALVPGAIIWGVSIAAYIVLIFAVFKDMRDSMMSLLNTDFYKSFGFASLATNENLLAPTIFLFAIVLYASYTVTQVASWTGEETEGRLELVLSTPQPRWRMLLNRFAATILASGVMIAITGVTFWVSATLAEVSVNLERSIGAFLASWVLCVIVAGFGFSMTAFKPRWTVAVLMGLVIISFMVDFLKDALKLWDWIVDLSIFHQYGQPLMNGMNWTAQFVMLGLSVAFVIVAIVRFGQRDIVK
jgi:ABC-2 type transport system permease protein